MLPRSAGGALRGALCRWLWVRLLRCGAVGVGVRGRDAVVAWLLPANPGRGVAGGVVFIICGMRLFDLVL